MPSLINITAFMLFWLLLVSAAFYGWDLAASVALACWLAIHLRYSRYLLADLRVIALALAIGPISDALLQHSGLVDYPGFRVHSWLPPVWVYAMWANFAQLLNHSFNSIRGKTVTIALTGLAAAPGFYVLGAALGAATLNEPKWQAVLVVALCWSAILPLLMRFSVPARR